MASFGASNASASRWPDQLASLSTSPPSTRRPSHRRPRQRPPARVIPFGCNTQVRQTVDRCAKLTTEQRAGEADRRVSLGERI
jgi:hypothetical protein